MTDQSDQLNWEEAKEHLNQCLKVYNDLPIGSTWFALRILNQLADRFAEGERSKELHQQIMKFKL